MDWLIPENLHRKPWVFPMKIMAVSGSIENVEVPLYRWMVYNGKYHLEMENRGPHDFGHLEMGDTSSTH